MSKGRSNVECISIIYKWQQKQQSRLMTITALFHPLKMWIFTCFYTWHGVFHCPLCWMSSRLSHFLCVCGCFMNWRHSLAINMHTRIMAIYDFHSEALHGPAGSIFSIYRNAVMPYDAKSIRNMYAAWRRLYSYIYQPCYYSESILCSYFWCSFRVVDVLVDVVVFFFINRFPNRLNLDLSGRSTECSNTNNNNIGKRLRLLRC